MKLLYEAISCTLTWWLGNVSLILVLPKTKEPVASALPLPAASCENSSTAAIHRTNRGYMYTGSACERKVFLANLLPGTLYKFIDVSNSPNDSWQNKRTGLTLAQRLSSTLLLKFLILCIFGNRQWRPQIPIMNWNRKKKNYEQRRNGYYKPERIRKW